MFPATFDICACVSALLPGRIEHFRYDWKRTGLWNLLFVAGIGVGGFLASQWGGSHNVEISEQTRLALTNLGLHDFSGLAPRELFTWPVLFTTERIRIDHSGRFSRRLRHGLCRRVHFRSCDFRSGGPTVTLVDRGGGLLRRRSYCNIFYSSADLLSHVHCSQPKSFRKLTARETRRHSLACVSFAWCLLWDYADAV